MSKQLLVKIFKIDAKDQLLFEEVQDHNGHVIRRTEYGQDGEAITSEEKVYDGEQLIEEKLINVIENSTETIRTDYNSERQLVKESIIYAESQDPLRVYQYTPDGKVASIEHFEDGTLDYRETFEYNDQNLLSKKIQIDSDDTIWETETYEYNESDHLTKAILVFNHYNEAEDDQNLGDTTITEFQYDAQGQLIRKTYPGDEYHEVFEYDQEGRLITALEKDGQQILTKQKLEYNSEGRIAYSEQIEFDADEIVNEYSLRYEYSS